MRESPPGWHIPNPHVRFLQIRPTGSCELSFLTTMDMDDFLRAIGEHCRIFRLEVREYDGTTKQCVIQLIPDNGMVEYRSGEV